MKTITQLSIEQKMQAVIFLIICVVATINYLVK